MKRRKIIGFFAISLCLSLILPINASAKDKISKSSAKSSAKCIVYSVDPHPSETEFPN